MHPRAHESYSPSWRTALAAIGVGAGLVVGAALTVAAPADDKQKPGAAPALADKDPEIPFEKYTLDNGLEVILSHDPAVPLVAIDVWYHVGSGHEVPGKTGFAHLFEHMLFQGSKNVGSDRHFDVLKSAGSSEVNGTTNSDRTNYYEVLPSHQLELGLWLESDRMAHLLPMLTQESLANQIEVVRNERRERYDTVPYGATRFAVSHALYPDGHPYRDLTIGKHEDLTSASLEDVKNFYRTWYVPANATLAIAGDFDPKTIRATVQKWFGSLPTSVKPKVVAIPPPRAQGARVLVADGFAKLRQVSYVWLSPAMMAPGDAELDILADALVREGTGRLYRILVHERQLAQSVSAYQWGKGFSGEFNVVVTLRSEADLAAVERVVVDEIGKLRSEALSERERARAVTAIEAGAIRGLEGVLMRAEQLQAYNHYLGDPGGLGRDLARYREASVDDIRQTAAQYLDPAKAVVVVTSPAPAPKVTP